MLLEAVLAAFALTQVGYIAVNCGLAALFVRRPVDEVDERTLGRVLDAAEFDHDPDPQRRRADGGQPDTARASPTVDHGPGPDCRLPAYLQRRVRILVPVSGDRWDALEETLASVAAQSYPVDRLTVAVVYETDDPGASALAGAIESARTNGLDVLPVAVDGEEFATDHAGGETRGTDGGVSRPESAMLSDAVRTLSVANDDVVTVFRPGTRLPVDAFELAVAGLQEYDIVQAKRTAGNIDDGLLPLLESAGGAMRSDLSTATVNSGPFRLLDEGYFVTGRVLSDLENYSPEPVIGGLNLGVAAFRRGYALGVLDRYVLTRCPGTLDAWINEKRRQVRESYRRCHGPDQSLVDRFRLDTGATLTHLLAGTNVVGIPVGVLVVLSLAVGWVPLAGPLLALVVCNAIGWAYYSVRAHRAARSAVSLESRRARLRYSLLSNPIAHALYLMLWAVPIGLALRDAVSGNESSIRAALTE